MRRQIFFLVFASLVLLGRPALADRMATGDPAATFDIETTVPGLSSPTDLRFLPDGSMVITEKGGNVKIRTTGGMTVTAGSFDVDADSEKGLLGVEVHPDFATNRTLFFYYSDANGSSLDKQRIVSITLSAANMLMTGTEKILLRNLRGPANHDGGALALSQDGKQLFVGVGDTGCNADVSPPQTGTPPDNFFATCLSNGNGKILRINLDGSIPTDNPLVGMTAVTNCGMSCNNNVSGTGMGMPRTEIWAWGFRNPWRIWTDPKTGLLWVGDVGESAYEDITIARKGTHHGWPWREGAHGYPASKCKEIVPDVGDCVDPVFECSHGGGANGGCDSITGGAIVDSCTWPASYRGKYLFGDISSEIWTLDVNAARDGIVGGSRKEFAVIEGGMQKAVSFREGPDGDLYVVVFSGGGRIVRIGPKTPAMCPATPPDAGAAGSGGSGGGAAGGAAQGGSGGGSPGQGGSGASGGSTGGTAGTMEKDGKGGCGCALGGRAGGALVVLLIALTSGGVLARRRRR